MCLPLEEASAKANKLPYYMGIITQAKKRPQGCQNSPKLHSPQPSVFVMGHHILNHAAELQHHKHTSEKAKKKKKKPTATTKKTTHGKHNEYSPIIVPG